MSTAKHVREIPALCSPSQSSRADVMWSMRLVASSFKVAICFWNSTTNEWDQQWQQFFFRVRELWQQQRQWETRNSRRLWTPLCRHCTTVTWNPSRCGNTEEVNTPRRTLVRSPTIHFTYIWYLKRIEMIATDFEKTQRLFLIATLTLPSPSSLLKLPILFYVALTAWRDTFTFLVNSNCKL